MVGSFTASNASNASANTGDEAAFVTALNNVRAGLGLPALTLNAELSDLARGHAQVMADAGHIFHADPISAGYTGAWAKMGENVGVGANVSVLVDAFVASPGHYANIIDPAFTQIGVGVVWQGNALYTTHRFLQVPGEAPTTTAAPSPTTATTTPPVTAAPVTGPGTNEPTTVPAGPGSTTAPTTTVPPLVAADLSPQRIVSLLEMLQLIGT